MKKEAARIVGMGGGFVALAVMFQASPAFMPGIGLLLSPFSTLPVALSAFLSPCSGLISLLASIFILLFISPQEAIIFILTTGPLGLVLGICYRKGVFISILAAAGTIFTGICLLIYAAGVAAFGGLTPGNVSLPAFCIFILFSLCYSYIWTLMLKFFVKLLKKIGDISI